MSSTMMTTTPTTMMSSSASSTPPLRYQRLLDVIEKALLESKSNFDMDEAIQECYGEEGMRVFSDNNNNNGQTSKGKKNTTLLHTVIESMMDRVTDSVNQDMMKVLKDNNVLSKLSELEQVVSILKQHETDKQEKETSDKQSAQMALQNAQLPDNMTPDDILVYHAHKIMLEQKKALEQELADMERQTEELQQKLAQAESKVKANIRTMDKAGAELERTADVCSMVS